MFYCLQTLRDKVPPLAGAAERALACENFCSEGVEGAGIAKYFRASSVIVEEIAHHVFFHYARRSEGELTSIGWVSGTSKKLMSSSGLCIHRSS